MDFFDLIVTKLSAPVSLWAVYIVVYFSWGFAMNEVGKRARIACFTYWWQIITCYILYMVPISLVLRDLPVHQQYLWGLLMMGILEFLGYWLGSSKTLGITEKDGAIVVVDNPLIKAFNIQNFSLGMTLFFALYFPLGNAVVGWIHGFLT